MQLFIDTETHLVEPGAWVPRLVAIGYMAMDNGQAIERGILARDEAREWVASALDLAMLGGCRLIAHFAPFDLAVLANAWPELLPLVFAAYERGAVGCTWVREQLGDIATEGHVHRRKGWYSLEQLADRRLGMRLEKDHRRLTYAALDGVPVAEWPAEYRDYLNDDVTALARCWANQEEARGHEPDLFCDEDAQARAYFALYLSSAWGITTDAAKVQALAAQVLSGRGELEQRLQASGVVRKDGSRDMKVLRELVIKALGDQAPRTAKGAVSTDADTIETAAPFDPVLATYQQYQADANVLSTFLPQLERGAVAPLHPRYGLVVSGRTSASDPNIQQMPRKPGVRECFVPRPGRLFAACDYDALEMRTLAQVLLWTVKRSRLAQLLNEGLDPHLDVAAQILGVPYQDALARKAAHDGEIKSIRQLAKAQNFGLPGGMSASTFVSYAHGYGVQLSVERSEALRAQWLRAWPEMQEYFQLISSIVGPLEGTILQFVSRRKRARCGFCDGANTLFQGLAADGAKAAVWAVQREAYALPGSALYGSRLVAFVHDELILEVPEAQAPEAAERLREVMVGAMQAYTPDVKITASPVLMRYWSKEAEELRDDKGRLLAWPQEVRQ